MPLRIQNYGEWRGDRRGGHHPPACTCYRCNEERRRIEASKEEERRVAEYDRRVAGSRRRAQASQNEKGTPRSNRSGGSGTRPQTSSQLRVAEAVQQSMAGAQPATQSVGRQRQGSSRRREGKLYGLSKAVTASALRYALALHAAAVVGLLVYALIQGGTPNVMPTLDSAAEAYIDAWRSIGNTAGLG